MKTINTNIVRQISLMIGITATLFVCVIFPFLSGDFDAFASQLSLIVQTFSIVGLTTCFPAILWPYHSIKNRKKNIGTSLLNKQRKIAKIYVYTFFFAFLPIALMTTLTLSLSMGIGLFSILVISTKFTLWKIERSNSGILVSLHLPLFLTLLPISLLVFLLVIDKPLTVCRQVKVDRSR